MYILGDGVMFTTDLSMISQVYPLILPRDVALRLKRTIVPIVVN